MVRSQQDVRRRSKPRSESALWYAGYGLHERGSHRGWFRRRSYYTAIEEHPTAVAALLAGIGALAAVPAIRRALPAR